MAIAFKTRPKSPIKFSAGIELLSRTNLFRLSPDKFRKMIAEGILSESDRVELLDGILVEKMAQNPPHATVLDQELVWPWLPDE